MEVGSEGGGGSDIGGGVDRAANPGIVIQISHLASPPPPPSDQKITLSARTDQPDQHTINICSQKKENIPMVHYWLFNQKEGAIDRDDDVERAI